MIKIQENFQNYARETQYDQHQLKEKNVRNVLFPRNIQKDNAL